MGGPPPAAVRRHQLNPGVTLVVTEPARRVVTLVLCDADGTLLGSLPPYEVPSPWWSHVAEVVARARELFGVDVVVLRLLTVDTAEVVDGGRTAYLAELVGTVDVDRLDLRAWSGEDPLAEAPHRMPYARPGGPQQDVAWARAALDDLGLAQTGEPDQVRTWNLSSIWRLPSADGPSWLKVVPPFFAHEGDLLERLGRQAPGAVPSVLAHDGGRMLLRHVPGEDRFHATGTDLVAMVDALVELQVPWVGRTSELLALGLPDWRPSSYLDDVRRLLASDQVDPVHAAALDRLVSSLPERLAALDDCGVPDTLLHGDFHPGNVRSLPGGGPVCVLDWGDSGVGHPLLDQTAFCERLADHDAELALAAWDQRWRDAVPGCEPERARRLLAPVAALRAAVVYQRFLDAIEPDERVYHQHDPATWLRRAAALATSPDGR